MRIGSVLLRSLAALFFLLVPVIASAQSSIAGSVKDDTGAVLPGVTVEASSPALIEKSRSVISDASGQFKIVDLRPGVYAVVFTLQGFNTFRREGITLTANATATVNGEMKVGSIEESITVTGEAPLVDVQNAGRSQVVSREMLDTIPTGGQVWQVGFTLPGVVQVGRSDVGGAGGIQQTRMSAHGATISDTTTNLDGMETNSMHGWAQSSQYWNDAAIQEMAFQTSNLGAESQTGGILLNLIPQQGGNQFKGDIDARSIPSDAFQGSNMSPRLRLLGVNTPNKVLRLQDYSFSLGGPVRRDNLWFFSSVRFQQGNTQAQDVNYPEDNMAKTFSGRLTWQPQVKNKFTFYFEDTKKTKGHETSGPFIAEEAANRRPGQHQYHVAQAKWTSTISPRLLVDAGWSLSDITWNVDYRPGVEQQRDTPAWFTTASHQDRTTGALWVAGAPPTLTLGVRQVLASSATYVTGSHSFKTGLQWSYGARRNERFANADLTQRYLSGVPDSVLLYNTPNVATNPLKADLGLYVQDSWTFRHMTITPGLRYDYFNTTSPAQSSPAGRWVPARQFAAVPIPTFHDLSPRLGVAYDVFGNGKTALHGGINKYVERMAPDFSIRYNPNSPDQDTRTWNDANHDDVVQLNELGPSQNLRFGIASSTRPDTNLKRPYNIEYNAGVDHQLTSSISAGFSYYRRTFPTGLFDRSQPFLPDNILVSPADYTPVVIKSPLDGSPLTLYNLNPSKLGLVDIVDRSPKGYTQWYNGFETTFQVRMPGNGKLFGGVTTDRTVLKNCNIDDPNLNRFCDQTALKIPFREMFKLSGFYPLPVAGIELSGTFTSFPGAEQHVDYIVNRALLTQLTGGTAVLTQASVTLPLVSPGTKFLKQQNEMDFALGKSFRRANGQQLRLRLDIFNALNSSWVETQNQTYGPLLDRPTSIMQARLFRVTAQFHF
jgi:Carboxypeptidase regulatory-like domain